MTLHNIGLFWRSDLLFKHVVHACSTASRMLTYCVCLLAYFEYTFACMHDGILSCMLSYCKYMDMLCMMLCMHVGMVCPINAIDMLEILYIIKFDTEHPHIHLKQQDYKLPVHFVVKMFGEQFAIAPIRIVH